MHSPSFIETPAELWLQNAAALLPASRTVDEERLGTTKQRPFNGPCCEHIAATYGLPWPVLACPGHRLL